MLGGVALLFCFLPLVDVIAALVVIRITLQFLMQAIGLIVLRIREPESGASISHVALSVAGTRGYHWIHLYSNFTHRIRWFNFVTLLLILLTGVGIFLARAWHERAWPFGTELPATVPEGTGGIVMADSLNSPCLRMPPTSSAYPANRLGHRLVNHCFVLCGSRQ